MSDLHCPKCKGGLTLKEAIIILNGSGYQRIAQVRLPTGEYAFLPAGSINPNEVEIVELGQ